jgi:hypothetical protein
VSGTIDRSYDVSVMPSGEAAASRFYPIGGVFYRVHVRRKSAIKIDVGRADGGKLSWIVVGRVDPAVADQQVMVDVTAPSGKPAGTPVTLTGPNGQVQLTLDLRGAVKQHGAGTYSVQASIFDADELDDATSNTVQITI